MGENESLYLIYYTAATSKGALEANATIRMSKITSPQDIEDLRGGLSEKIISEGVELLGSGKVVIANIIDIAKI